MKLSKLRLRWKVWDKTLNNEIDSEALEKYGREKIQI